MIAPHISVHFRSLLILPWRPKLEPQPWSCSSWPLVLLVRPRNVNTVPKPSKASASMTIAAMSTGLRELHLRPLPQRLPPPLHVHRGVRRSWGRWIIAGEILMVDWSQKTPAEGDITMHT
uniref:Uncharacterized protein n=1 Tax=Oryza barthii TaxID=65489 RepID=A0A0D3F1B4_9ORYZ